MAAEIKMLEDDTEINRSIALAEEVFTEFEAHDYSEEGIRNFHDFLYGVNMKHRRVNGSIIFWGAYCGGVLAGVCALRDKTHISLLFVKKEFQRMGIGRLLTDTACRYVRDTFGIANVTLNSSPYGLPFYKAVGFIPTDMERIDDGIIYTPMVKNLY